MDLGLFLATTILNPDSFSARYWKEQTLAPALTTACRAQPDCCKAEPLTAALPASPLQPLGLPRTHYHCHRGKMATFPLRDSSKKKLESKSTLKYTHSAQVVFGMALLSLPPQGMQVSDRAALVVLILLGVSVRNYWISISPDSRQVLRGQLLQMHMAGKSSRGPGRGGAQGEGLRAPSHLLVQQATTAPQHGLWHKPLGQMNLPSPFWAVPTGPVSSCLTI